MRNMRQAHKIAREALGPSSSTRDSRTTQQAASPISKKWIAALFSKMQVRYLHKWTSAFPTLELQRLGLEEWRERLSGLTGEQIAGGLESWTHDWPPSVDQFRRACLGTHDPEALGLPSQERAWVIICNATKSGSLKSRWRHPVVFHAARDRRLDLFNLRGLPTREGVSIWGPVYAEYIRRYASGEIFEFPENKALEDQTGQAVTQEEKKVLRETVAREIQAMRAQISLSAIS